MTEQQTEGWAARVGPLRILAAVLVAFCLAMAAYSDANPQGLGIIPSQVTPGLVVFLVWSLPFDMLMARVTNAEFGAAGRARYRAVWALDGALLLALLAGWGPFFWRLLRQAGLGG
ncbi:MAG TPA: hypothetical protein VNN09_14195 [Candidatus Competibacteraceae bacterium]|nr:hypothetical protein [Candidatus Competibacteraceae bacterium]